MNGQPLPNIHGVPVRLVISGVAGIGVGEVVQSHLGS